MEGLAITGIIALVSLPIILMITLIVMQARANKQAKEQGRDLKRLWWQLNDVTKRIDSLAGTSRDKAAAKNLAVQTPKTPVKTEAPVEKTVHPVPALPEVAKPPPATETKPEPERIEGSDPVDEFEARVAAIFNKAIQWFAVGEDFRNKNVSKEYAIATTWLIRGAVLIILAGFAFFLKYSLERNLIPPYFRVAASGAAGIGMLIASIFMADKKYHRIGMGLQGAGIAVLYFSIFAAYAIYHLISVGPAYALMILITLSAGVLAVKMDSLLAAIFGIIGGYATPVILHTNVVNLPAFFSYILLLGTGALFVARYKNWRMLNFMSFVFTYVLFIAAVGKVYVPAKDFPLTITFLSVYFVLFSGLSVFYNLFHKEKITILELFTMLINLSIYLVTGLRLIDKRFGNPDYGAILTAGTAIFYSAQVLYFVKLKIKDRNLLLVLFTFAAFCLTVTFPLLLSGKFLLCAWAAQAFLFMWLSCKTGSSFLRKLSCILYAMCFWHLIAIDVNLYFIKSPPEYLDGLINRFLSMGMAALSTLASFSILKREAENTINPPLKVAPENDIPREKTSVAPVFFWTACAVAFVFLHFEAYYIGRAVYKALYLPLQTYIWLGALAFCSWKLKNTRNDAYAKLIIFLLAGLVIKLAAVDLGFWELNHGSIYAGPLSPAAMAIRMAGIIPTLAFLIYFRKLLSNEVNKEIVNIRNLYGALGTGILFTYLTLELNFVLHHLQPAFRQGGISILWGLFALTMIFRGIRNDVKALRIAALILFCIIAVKIFLIDLKGQGELIRTSIFIVLGIVMLTGAFLYIRFKDTFAGRR